MSHQNDLTPDPPLSIQQQVRVRQLTAEQLDRVDTMLLSLSLDQWRKVAMMVALTMEALGQELEGVPDVFFAHRVRLLVERGLLEAQGDLSRMRYSEVRRPART